MDALAKNSDIQKVIQGDGKTFALSKKSTYNWDEARTFCQQLGGDLATFPNIKNFKLVVAQFPKSSDYRPWIRVGGKRSGQDTKNKIKTDMYWVTGENIPITYPGWRLRSREPDSQMTVILYPTGGKDNKPSLASIGVSSRYRALCQVV